MKIKRKFMTIASLCLALLCVIFVSCDNPFAPAKSSRTQSSSLLGDQSTIDGVFKNFQFAYTFKDTAIFGKLLDEDFVFVFRNYDAVPPTDYTWGRAEEMVTTSRMFNGTQQMNLIWNEISINHQDSVFVDLRRAFDLSIVLNSTDIIYVTGKVNFWLKRNAPKDDWKIVKWIDESNY